MPTELLSPAEAVARHVPPGASVAVGGMHMTAAPMSLVRELVRQRVRVRRLVTSPSASLQADLPVGAGLVEEIVSPYVGFEHLGLAPCFRRAVEEGALRVLECDEGSLTHALYAGAGGIAFVPCPPGLARTGIPDVDPELYARVRDPWTGEERWAVRALRPDVALIAAREADASGTVALDRFPFTDRWMALAARRLVVQVERVVEGGLAGRAPGETIPGFLVAAVVVAPGGCHPTAQPGEYPADEDAIRAYLRAARDPEALGTYLEERIRAASEEEYLRTVRSGRSA
jgi:glutaconate CoA-transferase subunit A